MEQPTPPKLLDRVRQTIRLKHYSYRTKQTAVNWIVRYILFHNNVYLPFALNRKYPNADKQWIWQYVFPGDRRSKDPRTGTIRRHHLHENGLQKAIKQAVRQAKIDKRVGCHTFSHSFATHLLQNGYDICTVQELL